MSFGIYLAGIILVVCGLIFGAVILHTPVMWIAAGALVALGLGTLLAVTSTRQKDPSRELRFAPPGRRRSGGFVRVATAGRL